MKKEEITIRDPFVLLHDDTYYIYGTRSATTWTYADGFDCYTTKDLKEFNGPFEIFKAPKDFEFTKNFWAPECYEINNKFYFVTTFGNDDIKQGIYVMESSSPLGPFKLYSSRLTPDDWTSIDGTLYFEEDTPYLIFSHSFEDEGIVDGDYCIVELSKDLKNKVSEPKVLFKAKTSKWAVPVPFAKAEFGIDGDVYFSDGPNVLKTDDGSLYMAISSWGEKGYAVGVLKSQTGKIMGPWIHQDEPIYPFNGGHGMFFRDKENNIVFTLHSQSGDNEYPLFYKVEINNGIMKLTEEIK